MSSIIMATHMAWDVIEDDGWRKGPWTAEEDRLLIEYVKLHGEGRWNSVARLAGLRRNGKSCRLRWVNYLRPDLKRGQITPHEESIILELHAKWGNRWSTIARSLPGRTDNEIKNYWRTHFKKKVKAPSDAAVRARNRFLNRKQFLLQQEQQHHHHQQQHIQFNPIDLKGIVSLLDYSDHRTPIFTQALYPTNSNSNEEQGYFLSMLNGNIPSPEAQNEDCQDILWDGLWNFYDFHSNVSGACTTSRASLNNLVAPSC